MRPPWRCGAWSRQAPADRPHEGRRCFGRGTPDPTHGLTNLLDRAARRHGGRIEDVVVLELDVPRGWLRKSRRGLWYSVKDIKFGRAVRLIDFATSAEPCVA